MNTAELPPWNESLCLMHGRACATNTDNAAAQADHAASTWQATGPAPSDSALESLNHVQVVPEPVDKWQDVGNGHHNVLDAFYKSPERFAYTFQNYVFVTRMMQVASSASPVWHLCQRSVSQSQLVCTRQSAQPAVHLRL